MIKRIPEFSPKLTRAVRGPVPKEANMPEPKATRATDIRTDVLSAPNSPRAQAAKDKSPRVVSRRGFGQYWTIAWERRRAPNTMSRTVTRESPDIPTGSWRLDPESM
jgi:hypothetical protein